MGKGWASIQVKITDPHKAIENMLEAKKQQINEGIKEWIIKAGDILITNTPSSTGQFVSNWRFYVGSPAGGYQPSVNYNALRREVYHKRGPSPEVVKDIHKRRIAEEIRSSSLNFLEGGTKVVGFYNPSPYGIWLERGKSSQAPRGIVGVTVRQIEKELDLVQIIEGRL